MSEWRVGHKVPINVYEGDTPICQCHTPEKAAQIVAALNPNPRLAELIAAAAEVYRLSERSTVVWDRLRDALGAYQKTPAK